MVFCNTLKGEIVWISEMSHNPYFNRWFSAIQSNFLIIQQKYRHNPYFNRWFSAIERKQLDNIRKGCHNPYFNRWFSAI